MKVRIVTAALVFAAVPALSQMTGVSRPDATPITTSSDDQVVSQPVKPSAAKAMEPTAPTSSVPSAGSNSEAYGAYVPYQPAMAKIAASADAPVADPDGQIVTSVPEREGEVREGTLLRVKMQQELSTIDTVRGSQFSAELTEAVLKDGRAVLPAGSVVEGRVTQVRSGTRIKGAAALHLEPTGVTTPDGTHYVIHAQLIDTDQTNRVKVNDEGTVLRRDRTKETLAVIGGATGVGAVTGGMIGGGVGAVVGAGIGAGVSTVVWLRQDRQAVLPKDSALVFSLVTPMEIRPLGTGAVSLIATPVETTAHGAQ